MIDTTWGTVGQAYMALRARETDARIMAAMGKPLPNEETQRIRDGLKCLHEYVLSAEEEQAI